MAVADRRRLGWELSVLLVLKGVLLGLLWLLFFPDSRRPVIDAAAVQRHLAPTMPQTVTDRSSLGVQP